MHVKFRSCHEFINLSWGLVRFGVGRVLPTPRAVAWNVFNPPHLCFDPWCRFFYIFHFNPMVLFKSIDSPLFGVLSLQAMSATQTKLYEY